MLAELGIDARVETPAIPQHGLFEYTESSRVVVRRQDADDARRIATEFDQLLQLPPTTSVAHEKPMTETADEIIEAWPRCPHCDMPRLAECRLCGASRDFFPSAYQQEGESHNLRFCLTCDDVAELQYARRCHQCSHDYGEGFEPPEVSHRENESRAWMVLWLMLAGSAGLAGYFYFLFRR